MPFGIVLGLCTLSAHAATISVNTTSSASADDGVCSLPEAFEAADSDTVSGGSAGECSAGDGGGVFKDDNDSTGPINTAKFIGDRFCQLLVLLVSRFIVYFGIHY